jgi:hypothetical protein
MKITKRQLRTIIKEEKSRLLNENLDQELYGKIDKAYTVLINLQRTLAMERPGVPRYINQALTDIEELLLNAIDHMDKSL